MRVNEYYGKVEFINIALAKHAQLKSLIALKTAFGIEMCSWPTSSRSSHTYVSDCMVFTVHLCMVVLKVRG